MMQTENITIFMSRLLLFCTSKTIYGMNLFNCVCSFDPSVLWGRDLLGTVENGARFRLPRRRRHLPTVPENLELRSLTNALHTNAAIRMPIPTSATLNDCSHRLVAAFHPEKCLRALFGPNNGLDVQNSVSKCVIHCSPFFAQDCSSFGEEQIDTVFGSSENTHGWVVG